jgi:hypothetical protein
MSIRTTAKSIGINDAKNETAMVTYIKAYNKAKPEVQAEMRRDYQVGYIAGRGKVSMTESERILSNGKGAACESKAHNKLIDQATSSFSYYRTKFSPAQAATTTSHARISKQHRDAAKSFIEMFEGKDKAAKIQAAIAVLRAMTK